MPQTHGRRVEQWTYSLHSKVPCGTLSPVQRTTRVGNASAQMRKGVLECCVLTIISRGDAFAGNIRRNLARADLAVSEGTLYPLLSRLRADGLVLSSRRASPKGPPRTYYALSPKGDAALRQLRRSWKELATSLRSLMGGK